MSFFPFINPPVMEIKSELPLYKEIAWDFKKNIPIVENGEFKIVEGNEALKVWVLKALLTNRYEHLIYSFDYGNETKEIIGKNYTRELTEMEVKRYIKEALEINPYITGIEVNKISFIDTKLTVNVQLETVYGTTEVIL